MIHFELITCTGNGFWHADVASEMRESGVEMTPSSIRWPTQWVPVDLNLTNTELDAEIWSKTKNKANVTIDDTD